MMWCIFWIWISDIIHVKLYLFNLYPFSTLWISGTITEVTFACLSEDLTNCFSSHRQHRFSIISFSDAGLLCIEIMYTANGWTNYELLICRHCTNVGFLFASVLCSSSLVLITWTKVRIPRNEQSRVRQLEYEQWQWQWSKMLLLEKAKLGYKETYNCTNWHSAPVRISENSAKELVTPA